jgi:glycosyltransferase involved in cell wall biosynthesis
MDFSIIIPAYNEEIFLPRTLTACADALQKLSGEFSGEIIVVDNNSTDHTADTAKSFGAKVVFEKENCIAKARNRGAEHACGRFLVFIDADSIAPIELIRKSLVNMSQGTHCGGGSLVNFDEKKLALIPSILVSAWNCLVRIIPIAAGSFVYCLKDAWLQVGGFDERYYASEEIHFSKALRKWGKKNKLKFEIIPIKIQSSSRKFKDHSIWSILGKFFIFLVFPPGLRKKSFCSFWYERKT